MLGFDRINFSIASSAVIYALSEMVGWRLSDAFDVALVSSSSSSTTHAEAYRLRVREPYQTIFYRINII